MIDHVALLDSSQSESKKGRNSFSLRNDGSFVAKKSEKSLYDASPINRENYSRPKAIR